MTWRLARNDSAVHEMCLTLDGYKVAFGLGIETDQRLAQVLVCTPQPDRGAPVPVRVGDAQVEAAVRADYILAGMVNGFTAYRGPGAWLYFTASGWVDGQSQPVPLGWEIVGGGPSREAVA